MQLAMARELPTLLELGFSASDILSAAVDPRAVMPFAGGEAAALVRMNEYIWYCGPLGAFTALVLRSAQSIRTTGRCRDRWYY